MKLDDALRDRLSKYPAWISDVIERQQRALEREEESTAFLSEQIDMLTSRLNNEATTRTTNTTLLSDIDNAPDIPLGDGVTIRFGVGRYYYDVTYNAEHCSILVEADADLSVYPEQSYEVKIARRDS
jgi:hypothetical protein